MGMEWRFLHLLLSLQSHLVTLSFLKLNQDPSQLTEAAHLRKKKDGYLALRIPTPGFHTGEGGLCSDKCINVLSSCLYSQYIFLASPALLIAPSSGTFEGMKARLQKHTSVYHEWLSRGSLEQKGAGPFLQKPSLYCLQSGPDFELEASDLQEMADSYSWALDQKLVWSYSSWCEMPAVGEWFFWSRVSASQYSLLQALPDNASPILWILIPSPLLHPSNIHFCAEVFLCSGAISINIQGEFKSRYLQSTVSEGNFCHGNYYMGKNN